MTALDIGLISGVCAAISTGGILYLVLRRLFSEVKELHNCLGEQKQAIAALALQIANKYQRTASCLDRRTECRQDMKEIRGEIKSQMDEAFSRIRALEERTTRLEAQEAGNG